MSFESHPLLTNAPIQEAVIDFRTSDEGEDRLSRLEVVAEALGGDLPEVRTQRIFEGRLHLEDEGMAVRQDPPTVVGLMLRSGDGRRVAQVRRGGFSLSHLRPYESWATLYSETMRFWATYCEIVKPETVTRVATRFVNRLRMPERYETSEYFTTPLEMAPGVQGLMASFNYFYVLAADSRTFAGVRLANEAVSPGQEHSTVLFDIDCYIPETRSPEDDKITDDLSALRTLKNNVFFRTLTPMFLEELA